MTNPYRKDVRHLDEIDLYVLADLYKVKSHAIFHAIKKLICAGKRGAKDYEQDLMEAIESIERELQMMPVEEAPPAHDFDEQRIDAIGQNGNDGEHYGKTDGWRVWGYDSGGQFHTLDGSLIVEVKMRNGNTGKGPVKDWNWYVHGDDTDIMQYRLA